MFYPLSAVCSWFGIETFFKKKISVNWNNKIIKHVFSPTGVILYVLIGLLLDVRCTSVFLPSIWIQETKLSHQICHIEVLEHLTVFF